jgi:CRP-like cAMP-binding protein
VGRHRSYLRDEVVFRAGDPADCLLLVEGGLLKLTTSSQVAGPMVLALRATGGLVGEEAALSGLTRSATATAAEASVLSVVSSERLQGLLAAHPGLSLGLLGTALANLGQSEYRRVRMSAPGTLGRVAATLVDLCRQGGRPHPEGTVLALLRSEIAGTAGVSEESTWRALRRLERDRLLTRHKGRIVVTDLAGLSAVKT